VAAASIAQRRKREVVKEFFASSMGRGRDKARSGGARGGGANHGRWKPGCHGGLPTEATERRGGLGARVWRGELVRWVGPIHRGHLLFTCAGPENLFSFIHFFSNKFQSSVSKKQITILLNSKTFQIWQVDRQIQAKQTQFLAQLPNLYLSWIKNPGNKSNFTLTWILKGVQTLWEKSNKFSKILSWHHLQ
jgi:hypothetical protein